MNLIETKRLVLRSFLVTDAADLFEYLHQPTASCFFSLALKDMNAAHAEAVKRGASDEYLAVSLRSSGKVIGEVFAVQEDDTISIGWNFNEKFGGQGYAFEAATALTSYLFNTKNARRLYAYVEDTNLSSQRLCEKLEMRREGFFKEFVSFKNDQHGRPVYENTMQYALLRKEWELTRRIEPNSASNEVTSGLKEKPASIVR